MFNWLGAWIWKASRIWVFSIWALLSWCWESWPNWIDVVQSDTASKNVLFNAEILSRVELKTVNWNVIYSTNSDLNWEVKIDKATLDRLKLDNNLSDTSKILVESSGWVDMDPNKNGDLHDDTDMAIDGTLSSVLQISELDYSRINSLTTLVSKILRWTYW